MDWILTLAVIFTYLFIVLFLGCFGGKGREKSVEEYVVGSRSFGPVLMYFMLGGSIFSAFSYLGAPAWAYSKGGAAFYILAYLSLGMVPWWLWGPLLSRIGRKYNYVSQAQLFADRFQSKTLSVLIAIVCVIASVQYVTLQMKGGGYIFELASGGRIPFWAGALIGYLIVIVYVFVGGVRGIAWVDICHSTLKVGTAWVLGLYVVFKLYGGPTNMFEQIIAAKPTHLLIGPGTAINFAEYTTIVLVSVLGFTMWPHLFMRAYAAKSEKVLKKTIVLYPTFAIFLVPILFIGFAGILKVSPDKLGSADRILPYMFTSMNLSPFVAGIILAAALSAAMSTQDSITHTAATIFVQDFLEVFRKQKHTGKEAAIRIRIFVIVFGLVAYSVAIFGGQSLVELLLGAFGTMVQLLPLVLAVFYWPRATRAGAIAGFLTGAIVNNLVVFHVIPNPWHINAGIQGLITNMLALVIVSLLTKPMDLQHVRRFTDV
jgi:SSS family solute:Na+ symporter